MYTTIYNDKINLGKNEYKKKIIEKIHKYYFKYTGSIYVPKYMLLTLVYNTNYLTDLFCLMNIFKMFVSRMKSPNENIKCYLDANKEELFLVVKYKSITIKNGRGDQHTIKELYVVFGNRRRHIHLFRGKISEAEQFAKYFHSHYPTYTSVYNDGYDESKITHDSVCSIDGGSRSVCLGVTSARDFMLDIDENEYSMLSINIFNHVIDSFWEWESLLGTPYIPMETVKHRSATYIPRIARRIDEPPLIIAKHAKLLKLYKEKGFLYDFEIQNFLKLHLEKLIDEQLSVELRHTSNFYTKAPYVCINKAMSSCKYKLDISEFEKWSQENTTLFHSMNTLDNESIYEIDNKGYAIEDWDNVLTRTNKIRVTPNIRVCMETVGYKIKEESPTIDATTAKEVFVQKVNTIKEKALELIKFEIYILLDR